MQRAPFDPQGSVVAPILHGIAGRHSHWPHIPVHAMFDLFDPAFVPVPRLCRPLHHRHRGFLGGQPDGVLQGRRLHPARHAALAERWARPGGRLERAGQPGRQTRRRLQRAQAQRGSRSWRQRRLLQRFVWQGLEIPESETRFLEPGSLMWHTWVLHPAARNAGCAVICRPRCSWLCASLFLRACTGVGERRWAATP